MCSPGGKRIRNTIRGSLAPTMAIKEGLADLREVHAVGLQSKIEFKTELGVVGASPKIQAVQGERTAQ